MKGERILNVCSYWTMNNALESLLLSFRKFPLQQNLMALYWTLTMLRLTAVSPCKYLILKCLRINAHVSIALSYFHSFSVQMIEPTSFVLLFQNLLDDKKLSLVRIQKTYFQRWTATRFSFHFKNLYKNCYRLIYFWTFLVTEILSMFAANILIRV